MSRAWRIEFAGVLYHVLSRGNEQRKIFPDNEEIGDAFGLTYSSVSKSVSGIRQLIIRDKKIKAAFKGLYSQFKNLIHNSRCDPRPSRPYTIQDDPRPEDNVYKIQITFTKRERNRALSELHRMNIQRASLFPGLDGFAQSFKQKITLYVQLKI